MSYPFMSVSVQTVVLIKYKGLDFKPDGVGKLVRILQKEVNCCRDLWAANASVNSAIFPPPFEQVLES